MANNPKPRPINKNVTTQIGKASTKGSRTVTQHARASRPKVCSHTEATLKALRTLGIRRSSWRSAGTGIPDAVSRSVGSTSGRSVGTTVAITPVPYNTPIRVANP